MQELGCVSLIVPRHHIVSYSVGMNTFHLPGTYSSVYHGWQTSVTRFNLVLLFNLDGKYASKHVAYHEEALCVAVLLFCMI